MNNILVKNRNIPTIVPSLICADLCNVEQEVRRFENLGYKTLHVDILDGYFSPSMPIGLEMIKQLRQKTDMEFDVHLMVNQPEFFINEILTIGVQNLCFHVEITHHADLYLNRIKSKGVRAGLALNPGTPLSSLNYLSEKCDFILLMLLNPGFAGYKYEKQIPYALKKIKDLRVYFNEKDLKIPIEVDGRISLENISEFFKAGASIFVAGSTCLFKNGDLEDGAKEINKIIESIRSNY